MTETVIDLDNDSKSMLTIKGLFIMNNYAFEKLGLARKTKINQRNRIKNVLLLFIVTIQFRFTRMF